MSDFEYENEFEGLPFTGDQLAQIYAKLKVAQILVERGTQMAKEAANDLEFFKITNGIGSE